MELAQKRCVPCEGNISAMGSQQARELVKQAPDWKLKGNRLYRELTFKDFKEAFHYVNRVAELAESEGHHPDISINYNKVKLELWTHSLNGLSENDFILAAKINKL